VENEALATEIEPKAPKPYSWAKAVAGLILLPSLVWLVTNGVIALFVATGGTITQSLGFMLTSSSFILAAVLYILATGQIKQIFSVLKLKGFKWYYAPVGLGAAVLTYMVAVLVGMIAVVISQLGDTPPKLGSNSTSQTIGDISQGGSLAVLFLGFLVAILAPVAEEIFFRGALLGSLVQESQRKLIRVGAVILVSVIFGFFHFQGFNGTMSDVLAMLTPGLVGLTAAILTLKLNSLYPAIFTHLFYNGIVLLIITSSAG
jgi:membrane protease YdiL (CAAX protease family)